MPTRGFFQEFNNPSERCYHSGSNRDGENWLDSEYILILGNPIGFPGILDSGYEKERSQGWLQCLGPEILGRWICHQVIWSWRSPGNITPNMQLLYAERTERTWGRAGVGRSLFWASLIWRKFICSLSGISTNREDQLTGKKTSHSDFATG